ncbi:hypothetical protein FB45DRAFT_1021943 [Roridomyces roridus]|uniref:Uncharacterized protein n=1 Tax=Roridomyces roridus TaxID=1738132 RepID=A0AAD7C7B5_9AGAR|nr:hypothetical protein FB45DRAFT_1021943 [Roridomyces roridus]
MKLCDLFKYVFDLDSDSVSLGLPGVVASVVPASFVPHTFDDSFVDGRCQSHLPLLALILPILASAFGHCTQSLALLLYLVLNHTSVLTLPV